MNCKKCGNNIPEGSTFCPKCGEKVEVEEILDIFSENQSTNEENNVNIPNENNINQVSNNAEINTLQNSNMNNVSQTNVSAGINNIQTPNINSVPTTNMVNNTQKKKSNAPFIIVLVILLLIIIGLTIFIVVNIVGNKDDDNNDVSNVEPKEEEKVDNSTTSVSTNKTITVDGYEFTVPNGYSVAQESGVYLIMDDEKTAVFEIDGVVNESFSDYVLYAEELKAKFEAKGDVINGYTTKTVGGIEYLVYDVVKGSTSMYLYMAKLDEYDTAIGAIMISPTSTYDNALVKLSNVLSSSKGSNNSSASTFSKTLPSANSSNSFVKQLK